MTCTEVEKLLDQQPLDEQAKSAIRRHAAECPDCRLLLELRQLDEEETVPQQASMQWQAAVRGAKAQSTAGGRRSIVGRVTPLIAVMAILVAVFTLRDSIWKTDTVTTTPKPAATAASTGTETGGEADNQTFMMAMTAAVPAATAQPTPNPAQQKNNAVVPAQEPAREAAAPEAIPMDEPEDTAASEAVPMKEPEDAAASEAIPMDEPEDAAAPEAIPMEETEDAAASDAVPMEEPEDAAASEAVPMEEPEDAAELNAAPLEEPEDDLALSDADEAVAFEDDAWYAGEEAAMKPPQLVWWTTENAEQAAEILRACAEKMDIAASVTAYDDGEVQVTMEITREQWQQLMADAAEAGLTGTPDKATDFWVDDEPQLIWICLNEKESE